MPWILVEPYAGSAAFSAHLLGARKALVPYQGSKWKVRRELTNLARRLGFTGVPSKVLLFDTGPWGTVWRAIARVQPCVVVALERLAEEDPAAVYQRLHGASTPEDEAEYAAQFLFLQRLAYSGKAVGDTGGLWKSPGLNSTSAYGVPASETFGEVKAQVPGLVRTLTSYGALDLPLVEAHREPALASTRFAAKEQRVLVYIDPPYEGTTGYPNGTSSRAEVVALARAWADAGAQVIVSEQDGIVPGWPVQSLVDGKKSSSFRGKAAEVVAFSPSR